jgi:predicted nucleic acid-binding protein
VVDVSKPHTIDPDEFRGQLRRLVPYKVFTAELDGDRSASQSIYRQFVLAAAHEQGGRLASCKDCQAIIREKWGVDIELSEISGAIKTLVHDGKLIRDKQVELTEESAQDLALMRLTAKELETGAIAAWEAVLQHRFASLGHSEVAALREDLISCIHGLITDRGIEAAIVLFPEQARFKHRLQEILALKMSHLPSREPAVELVRRDAIQAFFTYMMPIQRQWFEALMTTAHLMAIFTLEPAAFDTVRSLTNGQRLYLDTNVVYPLLKLNSAARYATVKQILTAARLQGYDLCITPWTCKEMIRSVRRARAALRRRRYAGHPENPDDLREAVAMSTFKEALRQRERETGESEEDFFNRLEEVPYLLELEGVRIEVDGCEQVDTERERIQEQAEMLSHCEDGGMPKFRAVQEHDVKLRLLIERLRGGGVRRLSNVGYLLLTSDKTVVRYAAQRNEVDTVPFAVDFDSWGEKLRALHPRSSDYDATMALLLSSPALHIPDLVTHEHVLKAITQIGVHEEYPLEMSVRMLLDQQLADEPRVDDDVARGPDEVGDARTQALEAQLVAANEEIEVLRRVLAQREREVAESKSDEFLSLRTREVFGEMALREDESATHGPDLFSGKLAVRWVAATYCFVASMFAILLPIVAHDVAGRWLVVDICCAVGSGFLGVGLMRNFRFANSLVIFLASAVTIVLAVQAFVQ